MKTWFTDLRPVRLGPFTAYAGIVGIDATARLLVEAGEDCGGEQYVSVITKAKDCTPRERAKVAKRMIELWTAFGEGRRIKLKKRKKRK